MDIVWSQGHLAWPFFISLVFSASLALAFDAVWRLARVPIAALAGGGVIVWAVGITVICLA